MRIKKLTMQHSIVNYKTVKENPDFRIDGAHYLPEHLEIEAKLNALGGKTIKDLSRQAAVFNGNYEASLN